MNQVAWAAKLALEEAKGRYYRQEITQDQLRAAAQAYLDALHAFKQATPRAKKLRLPSLAQLLR